MEYFMGFKSTDPNFLPTSILEHASIQKLSTLPETNSMFANENRAKKKTIGKDRLPTPTIHF